MSLKKRLIYLLSFSGLVLASSFLFSFKIFIVPPLKESKLRYIENLKKKFEIALSIEKRDLTVLCKDWTDWESMSDYVENPSAVFERDAFPDEIFLDDQLDLVLVINSGMNIVFYKCYWHDKRFIDFKDLKIGDDIEWIAKTIMGRPKNIKNIIDSNYEPILVVSYPIIPLKKNTPSPGMLVLGKFIDLKMIKRFSLYTMEEMKTHPLDSEQMNAFYLDTMEAKEFFYMEEKDKFHVFHLLKNINNKPTTILTSTSDNNVLIVVNRHMMAFITIIIFTTILLGIMLYQYINRGMIKRILGIASTMSRIEGLEDLSIRIEKDRRKDEISSLISNLNFTLDKLENEKINRENAEKAMIKQGKLASIGKLSSNIAHEINNPILAISNSIQVLKKKIKRKSELVKDAIEISETEIDRIRKIISGLLDFHRSKKEFTSLKIKEVILQTLEVLKWSNKLKSTKIIYKMGKDCFVYGSSVKLEEVFINLISNAVEAMEDMAGKSKLKIEVRQTKEKNFVEIHFIDNGPGLPAEVKNSLFEPFVSTKENTGVGLGLYIAYKLVNIHHGEIIYNEDYKEGAHFIINLPASRRSLNG